ncbi:MAG: hypothetical protein BWY76_03368 [bacterium ADurb.Bin429]|nr:MAG: hypothetical protein BWY76_03368 [bacterium ADurb.Bin429]
MATLTALTRDLEHAAAHASQAAAAVSDGGTCNCDGVFLRLPRRRAEKVLAAINAAGLRATKWERHPYYGTGYLVSPPGGGQADKRAKAADTMYERLREAGWDASQYHQSD